MAAKAFRKIQMGRESVAGTPVVATAIWRGAGNLPEDKRETIFPDEDVGILGGVDRTYVAKLEGALAFDSIEASFEQLPHVFEAGVKSVGTGVVDTGGSGKIYTYPMPTTAGNTIKSYTLEGGDDNAVERMEYGFVTKFTLEGNAGEALMVSADWTGRQVSSTAGFTPALVVPTTEIILFSKGKLYIDDTTMGTTLKSNTLLKMTLNVTTGWKPVYTADGNLYFSFAKCTMPEVTMDVTFEHDGTATAEKLAYRNQTPRLVRLKFEGNTLTTAGTYTYKTLIIDLAGKWESFGTLDDQDGNDTITGTMRIRYNPTSTKFAEFKVVNELTTIP